MSEFDLLTPQQVRLLVALVAEPSLRAAAARAGVSEATARRWRKDVAFEAALARACTAAIRDALDEIDLAAVSAVAALLRNLACGIPAVEIRAAIALLDRVRPLPDPAEDEETKRAIVEHARQWAAQRRRDESVAAEDHGQPHGAAALN